MRNILRIKFGSHLYGTANENSDLDYKSVFIPDARSILLQKATKVISDQRPKSIGEKNVAGDIDEEKLTIQKYLKLLSEGQTGALDMLFAPAYAFVEEPGPEWLEIVANKDKLITKQASSFVSYCRQQANKYGIKGERVKAAREAQVWLSNMVANYGPKEKLGDLAHYFEPVVEKNEFMSIIEIYFDNGGMVKHLEVCGRKMPYTGSIGSALAIMTRLIDEYGHRALKAENQQGVDWKAMSHSVRIAEEAIELLNTGKITFPLVNVDYVRAVKEGRLDYDEVSAYIDDLIVKVEESVVNSKLPEEPDKQWIDDFVCKIYRNEVING